MYGGGGGLSMTCRTEGRRCMSNVKARRMVSSLNHPWLPCYAFGCLSWESSPQWKWLSQKCGLIAKM